MTLPRLRSLLLPGLLGAALAAGAALRAAAPPQTVIESEQLDMQSTDALTTFVFSGRVVVTGTNLKITCDRLQVVTTRHGDPQAAIGQLGHFKSLLATGHVHILQSDREAVCGRAEVLPDDDKIILTENPVVRDLTNNAVASGPRMVLYRGERRAVIEGVPEDRARIVLPPIKDLGFGQPPPAPPAGGAANAAPAK